MRSLSEIVQQNEQHDYIEVNQGCLLAKEKLFKLFDRMDALKPSRNGRVIHWRIYFQEEAREMNKLLTNLESTVHALETYLVDERIIDNGKS